MVNVHMIKKRTQKIHKFLCIYLFFLKTSTANKLSLFSICQTYPSHNVVVQAVDKVHEFDPQEKHPVNLLVYGLFGCAFLRLASFLPLSGYCQICGNTCILRFHNSNETILI